MMDCTLNYEPERTEPSLLHIAFVWVFDHSNSKETEPQADSHEQVTPVFRAK